MTISYHFISFHSTWMLDGLYQLYILMIPMLDHPHGWPWPAGPWPGHLAPLADQAGVRARGRATVCSIDRWSLRVPEVMWIFTGICRVPKIGVPPVIIHFTRILHYQPSIWGYHHLWKSPYNGNNLEIWWFTKWDISKLHGDIMIN